MAGGNLSVVLEGEVARGPDGDGALSSDAVVVPCVPRWHLQWRGGEWLQESIGVWCLTLGVWYVVFGV